MSTGGPSTDGWSDGARQSCARRYSTEHLWLDTSVMVGPAAYVCTQQCGTRINGVYPVLLEWVTTPQVPLTLRGGTLASIVSGGEARKAFSSQVSEIEPVSLQRQLSSFLDDRLALISRVRDAMVLAQDKQKEYSDKNRRGNLTVFMVGDLVLLNTKNLPLKSNQLKHRFIGPFDALVRHGTAYTIDLPKSMATHPTFYVGRLKRYHDPLGLPSRMEKTKNSPPRNEVELSGQPELSVSKPVNGTQAGTHANHTRGGSRNMVINTSVELSSFTAESVTVLSKDPKALRLANLGSSEPFLRTFSIAHT
ncbi:LOW QUALITY PROTEIN: Pol protein [Phytophthora palmivora]|uniref:Pol protein n=1 Tax=Phytophthora palmivora TaxID=4796 RepID=A0A2P4X4E2_9STRA|nr:LOW QUALITY PROTEIN: Pol protein [Phytophthora palmivora]